MSEAPLPVEVKVEVMGTAKRVRKLRLRTAKQAQRYFERLVMRYEEGEITAEDMRHLSAVFLVAIKLAERAEHEREMRLLDRACGTEREFPRLVKAEVG